MNLQVNSPQEIYDIEEKDSLENVLVDRKLKVDFSSILTDLFEIYCTPTITIEKCV